MLFERTLVYPAPLRTAGDWEQSGLVKEDVAFASADGTKLHGWYFRHPEPRAYVLYCHGNGADVASTGELMADLRDRLQISIFAWDYRGYGQSEGVPFEQGVVEDGKAAHQWLRNRESLAESEIVLFGRSLGGAVGVRLAEQLGTRGLILDRTFDSLTNTAARRFPWMPVRYLMRNRFDSAHWIAKYHNPLLQLHGKNDEIVPYDLGKKLFDGAPSENKEFIPIEDWTHSERLTPKCLSAIDEFIEQLNDKEIANPTDVDSQ